MSASYRRNIELAGTEKMIAVVLQKIQKGGFYYECLDDKT